MWRNEPCKQYVPHPSSFTCGRSSRNPFSKLGSKTCKFRSLVDAMAEENLSMAATSGLEKEKGTDVLEVDASLEEKQLESSETTDQALTSRERRQLRKKNRLLSMEPEERKKKKATFEDILIETLQTKKKQKAKVDDSSLDFLEEKGMLWWSLTVSQNAEISVQEELREALRSAFQSLEFETFVPARPTFKVNHKGEALRGLEIMSPGCLYLKCALNQEIVDAALALYRVRGFVSRTTGIGRNQMVIPVEISLKEIESFRKKIETQELVVKEREEAFAAKQRDSVADETEKSTPSKIEVGANVKVVKGTFKDYSGKVESVERKKVKLTIDILGRKAPIEVTVDHVVPVKAA